MTESRSPTTEAWPSPEAVPPDDGAVGEGEPSPAGLMPGIGRPPADPRSFVGPESTPARGLRVAPVPSLAAIAGHPIHPMLVPLPIGAFSLALASDLAYAATRDRFWARASQALLGAGVATGVMAAALGATDFLGRERVREHSEAWGHAIGNAAALGVSALSLAARRDDPAKAILPVGLALSAFTGGVLLVTGWLGGELSYRYRVGVTADAG
jgi:uncharacterized membrane protein